MEGGAPREVQSNVENADWGLDGATLLLTHQVGGFDRMEFPPGKLIYQNPGIVGHPRFSPRGNLIAFFEHPGRASDDGSVAVVDLAGKKTILSTGWADLTGLAWSPGGDEIWFTGDRSNVSLGLFAVTLAGNERQVERVPGDLILYDIARDGRVLMGREEWRGGMYALAPGQDHERDLSWFDFSIAADISHDGKTVLFYELGEMGGAVSPSFLRGTDGTAAVRLSDGLCAAFSHDAQRVICTGSDGQLNEVPTKSGEIKPLTHDHLVHGQTQWFQDEKRMAFLGQAPGHGLRVYIQDLAGGEPRAITPEGVNLGFRLSPDGKQVAVAIGTDFKTAIYPLIGGGSRAHHHRI
jgi:WD40 repeat protein